MSFAWARIISPSAPLCDMKPTVPSAGRAAAKVAFIRTSGSVMITPMQFGPTTRIPAVRARSRSSISSRVPSGPVSEYPAVITTRPLTPLAIASSRTPLTRGRGTTTTARSIGPGMSRSRGKALMEWIESALGLTG